MTKSVVIALILFLIFYCIGFSIKLVKNQACNEDQCSFATSLQEVREERFPRKGYMRSTC